MLLTEPQLDSHTVGLSLINDYAIQHNYRLALFLKLDQSFNDHHATMIWARRYIEDNAYCDYNEISRAFRQLLPEQSYEQNYSY
ncbi:hypothetical protein [Acinetobacter sp. MD2]|uniref:hypothetical protein n=1 Tax=Acinetobacter sp. MD2 TaxID=2600066 RepID=UPI002D1EC6FF|nr:hypothetical protein [Acinetobacter sp. MD2]MEB3768396.1 hypothetical protein [Acinetobacter sp. MD2]